MPLVLSGTDGVSGVDGTASNPSYEGTDSNTGIFYPAADTVAIGTGGTEALRVNSAQNMGLGATPSTWTVFKALEVGAAGTGLAGAAGQPVMFSNCYFNAGWKYAANGFAANYDQSAGQHRWFNVASGSANAAITFTQAMTLDANGNFMVGATSNGGGRVEVKQAATNESGIWVYSSSTDSNGRFYCDNSAVGIAASFSSTGSFLPIVFRTSATERARITSGGDFLVGTTTASSSLTNGFNAVQTTGATYISVGHSSGTGSGSWYSSFSLNGTQIGVISQNGTTGVTYSTTSDYRLKENVQPMQGALATVAQLKPVTYTWKADGSAGQGFIAHELAEVVPDAVTGEKDAVNEDGSIKPQGIDTSFLVATLTAAIQELNAKVEAQAAEIAALKAQP